MVGVTNRLRFVSVRVGERASPIYMGLTIPTEIFLLNPPKVGLNVGSTGIERDFGVGQQLNVFIFWEKFANGLDTKEVSLEFGFKLIL
jgi:hypothetical protein